MWWEIRFSARPTIHARSQTQLVGRRERGSQRESRRIGQRLGPRKELPGHASLIGVDWSDSPSGGAAFVRQHHWRFPILEDQAGRTGDPWAIQGLPTTFVLDAQGRIVKRLTGPQTAAGLLAQLHSL